MSFIEASLKLPDARSLVRAASDLKPDVIVLDVAMRILNGLDAGRQVKEMLLHQVGLPHHESQPRDSR